MKKLLGGIVLMSGSGGIYWNHLVKIPKNEKLDVVFDIDETLIKSLKNDVYKELNLQSINYKFSILNNGYYIWIRPYHKVLLLMNMVTNLHIFTAATQPYSDEILNNVYGKEFFEKRLYRKEWEDCNKCKDLTMINPNLNNVILVDDKLYNNCSKEQLFYHIPPYGITNKSDRELLKFFGYILILCIKRDIKKLIYDE